MVPLPSAGRPALRSWMLWTLRALDGDGAIRTQVGRRKEAEMEGKKARGGAARDVPSSMAGCEECWDSTEKKVLDS